MCNVQFYYELDSRRYLNRTFRSESFSIYNALSLLSNCIRLILPTLFCDPVFHLEYRFFRLFFDWQNLQINIYIFFSILSRNKFIFYFKYSTSGIITADLIIEIPEATGAEPIIIIRLLTICGVHVNLIVSFVTTNRFPIPPRSCTIRVLFDLSCYIYDKWSLGSRKKSPAFVVVSSVQKKQLTLLPFIRVPFANFSSPQFMHQYGGK